MESEEQVQNNGPSNALYDRVMDPQSYQYPELALVSDAFKETLIGSMTKRAACSL